MFKTKISVFSLAFFFLIGLPIATFAYDPWPASDLTGTQIANYAEASGIAYHERLGTFFVVLNNGYIKQIDINGRELSSWYAGYWMDLEGITIADADSNYLYVGLEDPQKIYEFNISTNALTGKSWTLNDMSVASGSGLEALEYVNGYFYAGSQNNAKVYVYNINLTASSTGVDPISSFDPIPTSRSTSPEYRSDLSALSYSEETDTLYSLYDWGNRLAATSGDGTYINRYILPSGTMNEEGFVVVPNCPNSTTYAIITEDSGRIMRFSNFPIDYNRCAVESVPEAVPEPEPVPTDIDGDGYPVETDCNDADASIYANITFYQDADADGLGSKIVTTAACFSTAPAGHVSNNNDYDDSLADNGVEIYGDGVDNDGDGIVDEINTVIENGYHPGLMSIDPVDGRYLVSYVGMRNGKILVTYSDESIYIYRIFRISTTRRTTVTGDGVSANLMVTNPLDRSSVLINGYTGL